MNLGFTDAGVFVLISLRVSLHEYFSFTVHDIPTPFMDLFSPTYEEPSSEGPTDSSSSATTNGDSQELLYQGLNDKLIPIYCSILAAVVVGLVAFIIFKK